MLVAGRVRGASRGGWWWSLPASPRARRIGAGSRAAWRPRVSTRAALALGWGPGVARPEQLVVTPRRRAARRVGPARRRRRRASRRTLPLLGLQPRDLGPGGAAATRGGHRVVLYDQRGHGLSTRGCAPLTVETLAHDLSDVLEATRCARRRAGRALHGWHDDHVAGHAPTRRPEGPGEGGRPRGDCRDRGRRRRRPAAPGWRGRWSVPPLSAGRCARATATSSSAASSGPTRTGRTWT